MWQVARVEVQSRRIRDEILCGKITNPQIIADYALDSLVLHLFAPSCEFFNGVRLQDQSYRFCIFVLRLVTNES